MAEAGRAADPDPCAQLRQALGKCEAATAGRCAASSRACDSSRAKLKACIKASN